MLSSMRSDNLLTIFFYNQMYNVICCSLNLGVCICIYVYIFIYSIYVYIFYIYNFLKFSFCNREKISFVAQQTSDFLWLCKNNFKILFC